MVTNAPEGEPPLDSDAIDTLDMDAAPNEWRETALTLAVLAAAVVVLDQLAKSAVVAWIGPDAETHRWELAGNLLAFEYVENTGAAFGILAGQTWLLSVLALVVAAVFVAGFWRDLPRSVLLRVSLGLVLGGAAGNLVDRLRLGHVVDFVAVGEFPRFNVADSAITIGLALMAFLAIREELRQERVS